MLKHLVMIVRILITELGWDYTQLSHLRLTLFFEENSIMIHVCWRGNWAFENRSELCEIRLCCPNLFPPHEAPGLVQPSGTNTKWDKVLSCQEPRVWSTDCPVGTEKRARGECKEARRVLETHGTAGLSVRFCLHQPSLSSQTSNRNRWLSSNPCWVIYSFVEFILSFIQQILFTSQVLF